MDEHFRKMADQWRSNVTEASPGKSGKVMKVPEFVNNRKDSATSPECPELLSSGSDKDKVYSSDSGTFDTDEDEGDGRVHKDENERDYFYLSPRLDSKGTFHGKRVTFSKNLVKV